MTEIVTDKMLQKALDFLAENADAAAKAKSERKYIEEFLPALRAQIAAECLAAGDSASAADIKAKASEAYHKQLLAYKFAVENDEVFLWKRTRADVVIEVWRSDQARLRSMGKVQ